MKLNKNNNDKNSLYKNIYGEEVSILELTLKDFTYKNDKLYINNDCPIIMPCKQYKHIKCILLAIWSNLRRQIKKILHLRHIIQ